MASHTLGTRVKAERERRGFTLAEISASTKIPVTLLEGLERDDLSRWPKGLYRRAFFRSYVAALGLRTEPLVLEFARLFPDESFPPAAPTTEVPSGEADSIETAEPLALSLASPSTSHRMARSGATAVAEVAAVGAVGGVIAWASGVQLLEAIGGVSLVYLPAMRVAAGHGRRWTLGRGRLAAVERRLQVHPPRPASPVDQRVPAVVIPDARAAFLERCRPAIAGISAAGSVVAPVAQRAGQMLTVGAQAGGRLSSQGLGMIRTFLLRAGGAAGAGVATAARESRKVSARVFALATHGFWRAVRTAAEHAELLASRQLNRTRDGEDGVRS